MTHSFFKALLFLAAGSVIIGIHHIQDIRKMGGLKKYMPITYWTSLIGTLALIGFPGFSGFFSKDSIIEAVHLSTLPGATFAYYAVLAGVFVTALYSLRLFFIVFHGEERMDHHTKEHLKESPWVVTMPLILLAIPSVIIGGLTISNVLYGDYFTNVVFVQEAHDVLGQLKENYHSPWGMILHGLMTAPFFLMAAGIATAWYLYMKQPELPAKIKNSFGLIYDILDNKYGFDKFNEKVIAGGTRGLGNVFSKFGDTMLIDGLIVNGSAKSVGWLSSVIRQVQTGYLYHYAFVMILGLIGLLALVLYK
jgi:NADH-quinone oxidoreductase subunit L